MNIYYVYAYLRKSDLTPYYIGKGKGDRAWANHKHITVPKDKSKIVILETNLTNVGACAIERRLIRWWGRKDIHTGILLNRTDGGEGGDGMKLSAETRAKISAAGRGRVHSEETKQRMRKVVRSEEFKENLRNRTISNETRQKLSAAGQGRTGWNKGKVWSDDHKKKLSEIHTGKPGTTKGKKRVYREDGSFFFA